MGFTFVPRISGPKPAGGQSQPAHGSQPAEPAFQLIVVSDREGLDKDLLQLALLAAGSAAALLAATLWLIPRVLRRGLEPLERLGEQTAAIDSRSLGTRFSVRDLPEELRPIAVRLNDLLARIEQSFERERRFSADLAHELRTPLAELRSSAECALKWPESREAVTDRETLAIAVQMEGMVSHMLALARGEQGQLNVCPEPIVLADQVRQRWGRLAEKARSRGLAVELDFPPPGPAPATVPADPALLRAILDNILENAVEYTPAPGSILIAVTAAGVQVSNAVSDLVAADVPLLFERFWRKESARSGGLHVGLGLSLARAFAEAMGWTLEARLTPSGTLKMTLSLS
jgi:two-component system sensor histidine kinase QseC